MRLIITRHGETEENKAGILQGHLPGKLSGDGILQAKKVALRLKDEKIDYIYSSDLARSSDTAKEIAKYHPHTPIEFLEDMREINLGELQGRKKSEFGWDAKDFKVIAMKQKEGESPGDLYKRAKNFLSKIISKHKNNTVLLVGHNGINKALIAVITKRTHEEIDDIENQKNTSVNIFEIDEEGNHKIHLSNDVKHLEI